MTKISNLYSLTNYITANSSGSISIAAPTSGYALEVLGTGRYSGALSGSSATFTGTGYFGGATSASGLTGASELIVQNEIGIQNSDTTGPYLRMVMGSVNQNVTLVAGALTGTDPNLLFSVGGATRLTVTTSGSVGIGTTSPSNPLHISNASNTTVGLFEYTAGANSYIGIKSTSGTNYIGNVAYAMTFEAGGSERMRITSGGNVLIGTTTDAGFKLDVFGQARIYQSATNSVNYLNIYNNRTRNAAVLTETTNGGFYAGTSIGTDVFNYQIYDGNAGSARLTISSTGAATFSSSVTATNYYSSATESFRTSNDNGYLAFFNTANSTRLGYIQVQATAMTLSAEGASSFIALNSGGGTERMRITSSGNVGIGTTSPSSNSRLHVYKAGGSYDTIVADGDVGTNTGFGIYEGGSARYAIYSNGEGGNDSFNIYNFGAGSNSLTILTSGNVGIGTTSPSRKLDVNGVTRSNAFDIFYNSVTSGFLLTETQWTGVAGANNVSLVAEGGVSGGGNITFFTNGSATERMRITSGGNVLIGTTTDAGPKLQVNSGIYINGSITNIGTGTDTYTQAVWYNNTTDQVLFENGRTTNSASGTGRTVYFTWRGGPTVGGGVQLQHGTNAWAAYTSDARLKTIVANVDNGIETVMKLNPIKYKWTKELETSRTVLGFTAQNVGEAIPEAMFKSWKDDELGDVLSYYQEYLTPYLVKAIQELSAQNTALESRLATLENA